MYGNEQMQYRMQIEWNEKTTEWFRRASAFTGFHRNLSEILLRHLDGSRTICDLGCGAGMIDFHLAEHMEEIACVDCVPEVINLLNREIHEKSIHNMKAYCADIDQYSGLWDSCIMLFVGTATKNIGKYLGLCKEKLLVVDRGGCRESLTAGEKARAYHSLLPMINDFLGSGIRCSMTTHTLEYGQPLSSLEEAYEYVTFYRKNPINMTVTDYIRENLVKTDHIEYPYYLPYQKNFGVVEIRKDENLHLLS